MTTTPLDRRGEAHLWLVLEEALGAARATGTPDGVWEAQRWFRMVADALTMVGAVDALRADAIVRELNDALAVRGLVVAAGFTGRAFPAWSEDQHPVRRPGDGWLEAEIEHHLDLIVDFSPSKAPAIGAQMLELLVPVVRALQAAGSLPQGAARLADVAATMRAVGYTVAEPATGEPDRGWVTFLRDRPAPITDSMVPVTNVPMDVTLGGVRGEPARLTRLGWSERLLEVAVEVSDLGPPSALVWRCSVFDDAGRLHLGPPGTFTSSGAVLFRLRPGLIAGVRSLSIRLSFGAERLEEQVRL